MEGRSMRDRLREDAWSTLEAIAGETDVSVSELIRQGIRQEYARGGARRQSAMEDFVGIRGNRAKFSDALRYIRRLRADARFHRIYER